MDWLERMNEIVEYIEEHLDGQIDYGRFGARFCCSTYEFSRVFSFIAGISISEYVRRRRLSRAAFDIQGGRDRILDIALRYGYESQAAFTRAFKAVHGLPPHSARRLGASLKCYPKISFALKIKGVDEMKYRIEKKDGFHIIGLKGRGSAACVAGDTCTRMWREFLDRYNGRLLSNSYYKAPFWQVGAYQYESHGGETECIIGAELRGEPVLDGMAVEFIPAATWVVFSFNTDTGMEPVSEAYARILTEWFPESGYMRDGKTPHLEVYPPGDTAAEEYRWEIWMPVEE